MAQREEVAHQHGEAAVARHGDHLPAGIGGLDAERLRQGIGHRAVQQRPEKTPASVHMQVARRPHRGLAHVAGEHGVLRRDLVDDPGEELRVDWLAAGLSHGKLVKSFTGIAIMRLRLAEERAVRLLRELGQQRGERGSEVADQAEVEPGAAAEVLGT